MGRERIGLLYTPSSNWIGGTYYVLNIAQALNTLDDKDKPKVWIYCNKKEEYDDFKNQTNYPYLKKRIIYPNWNPMYAIGMRILKKMTGINLGDLEKFPMKFDRVKFVYPFQAIDKNQTIKRKCLGWIPDFQEKYLTHFFSEEELHARNEYQNSFIENNVPIVFSSNDACNDFFKFHPNGRKLKTYVLHFAVTHPDFSNENINILKEKFGITKGYLFCANQFWEHKNHLFLFKAFLKVKEQGLDYQLVCSGQLCDYRNKEYSDQIRSFIEDNHLENEIRILGFIDRTEQLCLMDNSYAIVQPSLFEGWSTVVEDAKRLNKFIFLSCLRVHQEQLSKNVCFFNPHDEDDLVQKLLKVEPAIEVDDYTENVKKFGRDFLKIIKDFEK